MKYDLQGSDDGAMRGEILIDSAAAAQRLSISRRKLWSLTTEGAIPCRRVGRSVRYVVRELEAWVSAGCPDGPESGGKAG